MNKTIVRRNHQAAVITLPADLHPVLAQIYAARNLTSAEDLDHALDRLPPPSDLAGIERAVDLLMEALAGGKRILVVADLDADGATACALTIRALRGMGAQDVRYVVPNRFEFSYGLTPEIVAVAAQQKPDLLITVDNGIAGVAGVQAARERGIAVLITDHHLPGAILPAADAIVNPNQPGDHFPSKNLAGVGVIFYTMLALRTRLRASGWFAERALNTPNLADLLDLVALGTVADVVPLDYTNRILVAQGIARINGGRCQPGIRALLEVGRRQPGRIVAADLAFAIGPRLNAAGRLKDMSLGIECLLTDDLQTAREMAARLDELNRERREIESNMKEQALATLAALTLNGGGTADLPKGLCLFDETWHQGVVGVLAARLREHTHRPVIAFAPTDDDELKGSARSVPGLHIRDTLDAVAARHPHLLHRFGGHAMAAGLTLHRKHLDSFSTAFDEEVGRRLNDTVLRGVVLSDGELTPRELTLEFAELVRAAGPWGQDFPEPVFDGVFEIVQQRIVGKRHLKLVLQTDGASAPLDAIAFNWVADAPPPQWERVHAAYRLDVNEYRGQRSTQLIIEHMEAC